MSSNDLKFRLESQFWRLNWQILLAVELGRRNSGFQPTSLLPLPPRAHRASRLDRGSEWRERPVRPGWRSRRDEVACCRLAIRGRRLSLARGRPPRTGRSTACVDHGLRAAASPCEPSDRSACSSKAQLLPATVPNRAVGFRLCVPYRDAGRWFSSPRQAGARIQ
jgi:hypothetical protein